MEDLNLDLEGAPDLLVAWPARLAMARGRPADTRMTFSDLDFELQNLVPAIALVLKTCKKTIKHYLGRLFAAVGKSIPGRKK